MEHKFKIGYGYIRWSTDEQKEGDSLERQQESITEQAKKLGITIVKFFIEDGVSATKKQNNLTQEWFKLKTILRSGDVVFVDNLDRITRKGSRTFYNTVGEIVEDIGAFIIICGEQQRGLIIDKDNYETDWNIKISHAVASDGNKKKDYYCKLGIEKYRNDICKGKWQILPYRSWWWIQNDTLNEKFVVNEERATIVRMFFEMYNKGKSLREITRIVNEMHVTSPGGKQWNYNTIHRYLTSKAVLGFAVFGEEEYKLWEPIISEDLWYSTQQKLKERESYTGPKAKGIRRINLFTNLAICKSCGEPLVFRAKNNWIGLGCRKFTRGYKCSGGVNYKRFEKTFLQMFVKSNILNKFLATNKQPTPLKLETLKLKMKEIQTKKEKLAYIISEDEKPSLTLISLLKKVELDELSTQKEIDYEDAVIRAADPISVAMDNAIQTKLFERIKNDDVKLEVKELIRHVVKNIVVDKVDKLQKRYLVNFNDESLEPIDVVMNKDNYLINGLKFLYDN